LVGNKDQHCRKRDGNTSVGGEKGDDNGGKEGIVSLKKRRKKKGSLHVPDCTRETRKIRTKENAGRQKGNGGGECENAQKIGKENAWLQNKESFGKHSSERLGAS